MASRKSGGNMQLLTYVALAFLAAGRIATGAEPIQLTGVIRDAETLKGIWGASVSLANQPQVTVRTDSNGIYSLYVAGAPVIQGKSQDHAPLSPAIEHGRLSFSVTRSGDLVRIDAFTLQGRHAATLLNALREAGDYSFDLNATHCSNQLYIIRIRVGPVTSVLKTVLTDGRRYAAKGPLTVNKTLLAKTAAALDTLVASGVGYQKGRQAIDSYTGTNDLLLAKAVAAAISFYYTIAGNEILVTQPANLDTFRYCSGDSLIIFVDTVQSATSTTQFSLTDSVMKLYSDPTTTSETQSIVRLYTFLVRQGNGTGVLGTWRLGGIGYEVVSGALDPAEKLEYDQFVSLEQSSLSSMTGEFVFSSGQITETILGYNDYAHSFIDQWNTTPGSPTGIADSALYDITVRKISVAEVALTGRKNNETVTITWEISNTVNMEDKETYASTNPAHATYTYFSNPVQCPNPYEPVWWQDFLDANIKPGLQPGLMKKLTVPLAGNGRMGKHLFPNRRLGFFGIDAH